MSESILTSDETAVVTVPWPALHRVILIASVVAFALGALLMANRLRVYRFNLRSDFVQEWTSARNYFSGEPVYRPVREATGDFLGRDYVGSLAVNAHPPGAVLVTLPLGVLSYSNAWLAWTIVSLACLVTVLELLRRELSLSLSRTCITAAVLLWSNPLTQQVIEGQLNLLLLGLLTGTWFAQRHNRPSLAGALLGAAAAIKLFPAFLVIYFVGRRQWRAVAAMAVSAASVVSISSMLFGLDIWPSYFSEVVPQFVGYRDNLGNASIWGLTSRLFVGGPKSPPLFELPGLARIVTLTCIGAITAICGRLAQGGRTRTDYDCAFATAMIGMLLVSPITWGHALTLLVLPVVILLRHTSPRMLAAISIAAISVLVALARPMSLWAALVPNFAAMSAGVAPPEAVIPPLYSVTTLSIFTHALLLLFAAGAYIAATRERPVDQAVQLSPR